MIVPLFTLAVFIVLMLVAPSKYLKQIQFKLNLTGLRILTGRRQPVGYLQVWPAKDLNSGLPWTNPASGQSGTLTRGFRIASPAL